MWPFHKNKSNESNKKKNQKNVKSEFKKSEILWKKTNNQ